MCYQEKKSIQCFLNKQRACRYSFSSPCCSGNNPIFLILITVGALQENLLLQQMLNQNCIGQTLCANYIFLCQDSFGRYAKYRPFFPLSVRKVLHLYYLISSRRLVYVFASAICLLCKDDFLSLALLFLLAVKKKKERTTVWFAFNQVALKFDHLHCQPLHFISLQCSIANSICWNLQFTWVLQRQFRPHWRTHSLFGRQRYLL